MTEKNLLTVLREKARQEQKLTIEVIDLIHKVNQKKIHLKLGYSSLFDFVTKDLGYEPSSAMRRIHAARLLGEVPEIKNQIKNKELSLTVVSKAQSFFTKEAKNLKQQVSVQRRKDILERLKNKSSREAEKELVKISPQAFKQTEKRRELTEELTELKVVLNHETCKKMEELKAFLAHQNPDLSDRGLIELLVNKAYKQMHKSLQPKNKNSKNKGIDSGKSKISNLWQKPNGHNTIEKPPFVGLKDESANYTNNSIINNKDGPNQKKLTSPAVVAVGQKLSSNKHRAKAMRRKSLSLEGRRIVWQRDHGQCQYEDSQTGKQCGSKYFLEIDHIHRVHNGGDNNIENLRLLCRHHNQWRG